MSDIDLALAGTWGERDQSALDRLNAKTNAEVAKTVSPVGAIKRYFNDTWPELKGIKDLWLTGGQVWRRFYGEDLTHAKNVDMFVTTEESLKKVTAILESMKWPGDDAESYLGPLGGVNMWTTKGRVDLWIDTSAHATLKRYSDARAHARMAYRPINGQLLVLANEVVRKPGDKYIVTNPDGSVGWRIE
jgi:hypothetical protein